MLKNQLQVLKNVSSLYTTPREGQCYQEFIAVSSSEFCCSGLLWRVDGHLREQQKISGKRKDENTRQTIENLFFSAFFYFKLQRMLHTLMNLYLTRSAEGLEGDRKQRQRLYCLFFWKEKLHTINQHLIE